MEERRRSRGRGEGGEARRLHCQSSDSRGMKRGGRTSTRGALLCDFRAKGANRRRENSATPFSSMLMLLAAIVSRSRVVPVYECFSLPTKNSIV